MHGENEALTAITVVLCVAAVTTVVFQRLRQPVVLGYLLAGVIVGPHVPVPLVADREIIQSLSELGVVLLMYSLGLEFSLRKLVSVGPTVGLTALVQSSLMVWVGFLVGRAFGWTQRESLFTGALIAISSTTIIAKAFDEQGVRGRLRELVVGVLIVEDLIAILLMAILTALSSSQGVSARGLAASGGRLAAFLVGLVAIGMLVVPRLIRWVALLRRPETLLVTSVGICFAAALLAQRFGYSVALGAFIAGSLVAESGEERQIEQLILPVRDIFAAIFFVSVGMLIEPTVIVEHLGAVSALTVVVILGKVVGVSLGAFLTGAGVPTSLQAGMSLAQIGEFSFIIASLGVALGATGGFLYPVAVAVSAITTLITPWLIRASRPVASFVDRKLPRPLQTFAALYGTWIERLRTSRPDLGAMARIKRLSWRLGLDLAVLAALVVGASVANQPMLELATRRLGLTALPARALLLGVAAALAVPLLFGVFRSVRALGSAIARAALPEAATGQADTGAAPRRALVVTVQLAVAFAIGLPILALLPRVVPGWVAAGGFGLVLVVLGVVFWRSALDLHGHVKAGAQVIVEALVSHARKGAASGDQERLARLKELLPGIGEPVTCRMEPASPAVGKTLAELNLRGRTGASALAIARGEEGVIVSLAGEVLRVDDVLALVGTAEAIEAAMTILRGKDPVPVA